MGLTCWNRLTVLLSHQYHVALVVGAGGCGDVVSVVDTGWAVQKKAAAGV